MKYTTEELKHLINDDVLSPFSDKAMVMNIRKTYKKYLLPTKEFNANLDDFARNEDRILKDNDGKGFLIKLLVVFKTKDSSKKHLAVVGVGGDIDWGNSTVRRISMFGLGDKFQQDGEYPLAAYLVSEAWVSTARKDVDVKDIIPSEDPNRTEAMIIAGLTIDGRSNLLSRTFTRINEKIVFDESPPFLNKYSKKEDKLARNMLVEQFFKGFFLGLLKDRPNA